MNFPSLKEKKTKLETRNEVRYRIRKLILCAEISETKHVQVRTVLISNKPIRGKSLY